MRGKQRLEVQGPRLNSKKEEMAQKVYGPDRRLDLVIQQEMPLLQVDMDMSRNVRKLAFGVFDFSMTNRAQKMARGWKCWI